MPWNTQDSANKHKYIYIVFGSGTMAKASPAPAIVALRRASQPTTKKLMACMHWHCSTESFCSASASLQLSAERKRKKSFSFYSSRETEWQAARSVPHLGTACIHACRIFIFAMTPPTAHSSIRTVKRVHLGKRGRSPRRRRC